MDDEQTVHMFHLDSELIFKESTEELRDYPYELTDEVEDPEYKPEEKQAENISGKLPAVPTAIKKDASEAPKEEPKPADDGEEPEEKG